MARYKKFIPVMKSNQQDGYEVSASSKNLEPYLAFDGISNGSPGSYYRSVILPNLPEYLTLLFPSPKTIGKYAVYLGYADLRFSNMRTWDFEGLINNEWITIHSGEKMEQNPAEVLEFTFQPIEVEGVRIKCKTRHGNNSWGIDELVVYEVFPPIKTLILSDGEYKRFDEGLHRWQTVSTALPSSEQFREHGMEDLSILDRKVQPVLESPIQMTSEGLGEGKVFKASVDLKKYFDSRKLEVK